MPLHSYEKHNLLWREIEIGFKKLSVALPKTTLWYEHLGGVAPGVDVACELLLRVELLVLALCPPLGDQTGDDGQTASSNDDTATSLVPWLLRPQEEVRSEPVRNLRPLLDVDAKSRLESKTYTADTVGNSDKCRSFGSGSRNNCSLPRDLNVQADEGTRTKQEDREVSGSDVEGRDHDDGAG